MDNIIYFNAIKKHQEHNFDILCLFLGESLWGDVASFYSALEESLKSCEVLPDGITVFYPESRKSDISLYWQNTDLLEGFKNRLMKNNVKYCNVFYFVEMNSENFIINSALSTSDSLIKLTLDDITEFYKNGLTQLTRKNDVVHIAPAGHTFKHPSGKISKLFIQTRELVSTETELQYTSRGLSLLTDEVNWADVETIYIDTMGIYPIVKEAVDFTKSAARIESFHSYDSIEDLNLPSNEYLIIISASTSGSMAKNLLSRGFSSKKIITLIDIDCREGASQVFINLKTTNTINELNKIDGSETDIELVGEQFSYKAKPPKQITIGIAHQPINLKTILKNFGITGINNINQKLDDIHKTPVLSLKSASLNSSELFTCWLKKELNWSLPSAVNTIVHNVDEPSKILAGNIKKLLQESSSHYDNIKIVNSNDLNFESLKECTGVIVVCAFAGDGGVLRQISRDLREFEDSVIPRHFLIGVGIPQSMKSWIRLEQFLIRNASKRAYNFSAWQVLPLGPDNLKNSWTELANLASVVQNYNCETDEHADCFDELVEVISKSQNSLLPNTKGATLKITSGFVFFGDVFDSKITQVTQSDTLLTIASALQAAREHKDPNNCLTPTSYQSVIVSPENFLRFNDDILQACILRSSTFSELDYSSDQHLSELMSEFLYKVFTRHEHPYGYAALEFAAALAVGKLKIKKEVCDKLVKHSLSNKNVSSKSLKGFLLAISYGIKNKKL